MSAVAESVVVLTPRDKARTPPRPAVPVARPLVLMGSFFALGLYGVTRWSTLLTPAPTGRLLGLLALATLSAGTLGVLARGRGRLGVPIAILVTVAVLIAALPIAGVPLSLVVHHHVGTIGGGISQGLSAMPGVLVPYNGIDAWVRVVIVLGAAVLLMDAALILAFAPRSLGDARRAGAALPLIALAVVPSTLMRPSLPYVHGLILLVLVAALVWGERLPRANLVAAGAITLAAGIGAAVLSPALDSHHPWINYNAIAGALSPSHVATFDWTQRYGPLNWPRTGTEILSVQAKRGDYWKAENLDVFDGVHWAQASAEPGAVLPPEDPAALYRWTQRVQVTIRGMHSTDVISAGETLAPPDHLAEGLVPGPSPGTWQSTTDLAPGDTYTVITYSPRPTHAELAATAGQDQAVEASGYWEGLTGYRSLALPVNLPIGHDNTASLVFPPFHSNLAPVATSNVPAIVTNGVAASPTGPALVSRSPYAPAYALAQQLAAAASTPMGFVENVERFLSKGYTYNEDPPVRRYPLESFLFRDKIGYCQQFAGAMALLLRMGGVPARVATGFTTGTYDHSSGQWIVSDLEAHAWVEAWFPVYGWVRFDPTPGVAPARGGPPAASNVKLAGGGGLIAQRHKPDLAASSPGGVARGHGSSTPVLAILAGPLALLLAVALVVRQRRRSGVAPDRLLAELERAFGRSGRPLAPGTTLIQLEHWFRGAPEAAAYVRALRLTRYGGAPRAPTPTQRRALRAWLGEGLGIGGQLRALWALPPRLGAHRIRLPARLH